MKKAFLRKRKKGTGQPKEGAIGVSEGNECMQGRDYPAEGAENPYQVKAGGENRP